MVDITDLQHPKVASLNPDVMLYAASLPKIAILLGAFVEVERGTIPYSDAIRAELTRMMRNFFANRAPGKDFMPTAVSSST